jgi:hypothetical protein
VSRPPTSRATMIQLFQADCSLPGKCVQALERNPLNWREWRVRNKLKIRDASTFIGFSLIMSGARLSPECSGQILGFTLLLLSIRVSSRAALHNSRAHAGLNVLLISRSESKLKTAAEEIATAYRVEVRSTVRKHPLASS